MLSNIPKEERPRERLIAYGPNALSLTELLAICLGSGSKGESVLTLSERLLSHFGSLNALLEASFASLTQIKGIGQAKAATLQVIFALSKRSHNQGGRAFYPVNTPADVYTLIRFDLESEKKEHLVTFMRDAQGNIFHHEIISIGILSAVHAHPREIFYSALHHCAYSLIIAHNHPSGNPTPSTADIQLTKMLIDAGELLGIPLDDHLIIGSHSYVSLFERGYFNRTIY